MNIHKDEEVTHYLPRFSSCLALGEFWAMNIHTFENKLQVSVTLPNFYSCFVWVRKNNCEERDLIRTVSS